MNYQLRLYWNDALVMDAKATAVVCYDTALAHIRDNFAGTRARDFVDNMGLTLDRVLTLPLREDLDRTYGDDTGVARFTLRRLVAA